MLSCDDKKWTFTELYRDVVHFAKACLSLGVEKHSAVTILGFNSPEWFIACIGAVFSGSMAAGIYTTSTAGISF
jgi:long-chain-fatty-acid--CoA ligase ACSBG